MLGAGVGVAQSQLYTDGQQRVRHLRHTQTWWELSPHFNCSFSPEMCFGLTIMGRHGQCEPRRRSDGVALRDL
jgi:hypothetical protein